MNYKDMSTVKLKGNGGFLIKKRQDPKSKFINGPVSKTIRRKKFQVLFKLSI